jgi:hypothetical protein
MVRRIRTASLTATVTAVVAAALAAALAAGLTGCGAGPGGSVASGEPWPPPTTAAPPAAVPSVTSPPAGASPTASPDDCAGWPPRCGREPGGGEPPLGVGDCVYTIDLSSPGPVVLQTVAETPCRGGTARPTHRILAIVDAARSCPAGETDETFLQRSLLAGPTDDALVYCAEEL